MTQDIEAFHEHDKDELHYPRSLILFIAIENEMPDVFEYLWREVGFIDWGLSNLEWALMNICFNHDQELLDVFLTSDTFVETV